METEADLSTGPEAFGPFVCHVTLSPVTNIYVFIRIYDPVSGKNARALRIRGIYRQVYL